MPTLQQYKNTLTQIQFHTDTQVRQLQKSLSNKLLVLDWKMKRSTRSTISYKTEPYENLIIQIEALTIELRYRLGSHQFNEWRYQTLQIINTANNILLNLLFPLWVGNAANDPEIITENFLRNMH